MRKSVKTQMSQLVIQYNVKFVKGLYLGDLLCNVMSINMSRITVNTIYSTVWIDIFKNLTQKNNFFFQDTAALFFQQDEKWLKGKITVLPTPSTSSVVPVHTQK